MKKKAAALAALALAGVMILTACSSSEQESDQQSAAKNDTIKNGTEVQTEEPLQTVSGTQSVSGTAVSVAGESGSTSDATAAAPAQSETVAAGETQTAQTSGTAVTETKSETEDGDIWSGTYVADDETLTIAMAEDTQISFSFAEAGISGVADVRGSQAVYKGDDHYVIVFNINGTLLDVSVSSEEDYDASDSPLIGTYVKDTEQ